MNSAYWGLHLLGKALMKVRARLREERLGKTEGTAMEHKAEGNA